MKLLISNLRHKAGSGFLFCILFSFSAFSTDLGPDVGLTPIAAAVQTGASLQNIANVMDSEFGSAIGSEMDINNYVADLSSALHQAAGLDDVERAVSIFRLLLGDPMPHIQRTTNVRLTSVQRWRSIALQAVRAFARHGDFDFVDMLLTRSGDGAGRVVMIANMALVERDVDLLAYLLRRPEMSVAATGRIVRNLRHYLNIDQIAQLLVSMHKSSANHWVQIICAVAVLPGENSQTIYDLAASAPIDLSVVTSRQWEQARNIAIRENGQNLESVADRLNRTWTSAMLTAASYRRVSLVYTFSRANLVRSIDETFGEILVRLSNETFDPTLIAHSEAEATQILNAGPGNTAAQRARYSTVTAQGYLHTLSQLYVRYVAGLSNSGLQLQERQRLMRLMLVGMRHLVVAYGNDAAADEVRQAHEMARADVYRELFETFGPNEGGVLGAVNHADAWALRFLLEYHEENSPDDGTFERIVASGILRAVSHGHLSLLPVFARHVNDNQILSALLHGWRGMEFLCDDRRRNLVLAIAEVVMRGADPMHGVAETDAAIEARKKLIRLVADEMNRFAGSSALSGAQVHELEMARERLVGPGIMMSLGNFLGLANGTPESVQQASFEFLNPCRWVALLLGFGRSLYKR